MAAMDVLIKMRKAIPYQALLFGVGLILIICILGVIAYFIIKHFVIYKYKCPITERIGNEYRDTFVCRARAVRNPETGLTLMHIARPLNRIQPWPEKSIGLNTYKFYWKDKQRLINIGYEDIDEKINAMKLKLPATEMSISRDGLQKIYKERFVKTGFFSKYGIVIGGIAFIAIMGIMIYLNFDKFIASIDSFGVVADKFSAIADKLDSIISKMDNVCTGGSGLVPA